MSKAQLKKHLLTLTKDQVVDQILELYETFKSVKEYYLYSLNPNEKELYNKYKAIIVNEFYPKGKFSEPKTRISVAKKSIADFIAYKPSPKLVGDLMVTFVEMACKFTYDYGDMWDRYYTSTVTNFERALKYLQKNGLLSEYKPRCEQCLKYAEPCGYGFPDEMHDVYFDYYK